MKDTESSERSSDSTQTDVNSSAGSSSRNPSTQKTSAEALNIEYHRKRVLGIGLALVIVLIAFTAYQAFEFRDIEDKALVCYIMAVPIFMTGLSFAFSYIDLKDSKNEDDVKYYLRRGYIFGVVMFVLSLFAIAVMYAY